MDEGESNEGVYSGLHSEGGGSSQTKTTKTVRKVRKSQQYPAPGSEGGDCEAPQASATRELAIKKQSESPGSEEIFIKVMERYLARATNYEIRSRFKNLKKMEKEVNPKITLVRMSSHDGEVQTEMADRAIGSDVAEIELTQLHQEVDGKQVNHVMLLGDAGSGKTIAAKRYAKLVSDGKVEALKDIKMVHLIHTILLQNDSPSTPFDLLFHQQVGCELNDPELRQAGEKWIGENPEKVLLIVDGLDQCAESFRNFGKITHKTPATPRNILANIFAGHLYPNIKVLSTSRWFVYWTMKEALRPCKTVALRGFGGRKFDNTIRGLCAPGVADKILDHLKTKAPDLLSLCRNPLFLVYTAGIFSSGDDSAPPNTFTATMIKVFWHFINDYKSVNVDALSKLAFHGMKDKRFSFTESYVKKLGLSFEDLEGPVVTKTIAAMEADHRLQYLHQIMQEFLAALHLFNLRPDEFEEVFSCQLQKKNMEVVRRIFYGLVMNPVTNNLAGSLITDKNIEQDICKKAIASRLISALEKQPLEDIKIVSLLYECGSEVLEQYKNMIHHVAIRERALKSGEDYALGSVLQKCIPLKKVELRYVTINPSVLPFLVESTKHTEYFAVDHVQVGEYIGEEDYRQVEAFFDEVLISSVILANTDKMVQNFLTLSSKISLHRYQRLGLRGNYSDKTFGSLARFLSGKSLDYLNFWDSTLTPSKFNSFCQAIKKESTVKRFCLQDNLKMESAAYKLLAEFLSRLSVKYLVTANCDLNREKIAAFTEGADSIGLELSAIAICNEKVLDVATLRALAGAIEQTGAFYLAVGYMSLSKEQLGDLGNELASKNIELKKLGFEEAKFVDPDAFRAVATITLKAAVRSLYLASCSITPEMVKAFADEIESKSCRIEILHFMAKRDTEMEVYHQLGRLLFKIPVKDLILGGFRVNRENLSSLEAALVERKNVLESFLLYADEEMTYEIFMWITKMFDRLRCRRPDINTGDDIITRDFSDLAWSLMHGIMRAKYVAVTNNKSPEPSSMGHVAKIICHPNTEVVWMDECYLKKDHFAVLLNSLKANKFSKLRRLILSQNDILMPYEDLEVICKLLKFVLVKLELRGYKFEVRHLDLVQQALDEGSHEDVKVILEREKFEVTLQKDSRNRIVSSLSIRKVVGCAGGNILIGDCVISFAEGALLTSTAVDVRMEIDSAGWPLKETYLCISPMLYVGTGDDLLRKASVNIATWAVNAELDKDATVDVLHRPKNLDDWESIHTLPFTESRKFHFGCSDFSPVIIGLKKSVAERQARFSIVGNIFVDRSEHNFIIVFRLRHVPETLQRLCDLKQLANFNPILSRIQDTITISMECSINDFSFQPRSQFSFEVDVDFVRNNKRVEYRFGMIRQSDRTSSRQVLVRYSIYRNEEPMDGGSHGFNYTWQSTESGPQPRHSISAVAAATQGGIVNLFSSNAPQSSGIEEFQNLPASSGVVSSSAQLQLTSTSDQSDSDADSSHTQATSTDIIPRKRRRTQ